jgi:hypothetical protein
VELFDIAVAQKRLCPPEAFINLFPHQGTRIDIDNIPCLFLVKSDLSLGCLELSPEPVMPGIVIEKRWRKGEVDLREPFERFPEDLFLEGNLPLIGNVLEMAPTAGTAIRAGRLHSIRRRLDNVHHCGPVIVFLVLFDVRFYRLAGDCSCE